MRPSKYDKYICVVCLIVFIYSFFFVYCKPIYESDLDYKSRPLWWGDDHKDEVVYIEWSSAVFVAPIFCIFFFMLILFERELLPVNRKYIKDIFKYYWRKHKKK